MKKTNAMIGMLLMGAMSLGILACEEELSEAFDDVRAAVPQVCRDFCQANTDCYAVDLTGELKDDFTTNTTEECEIICALEIAQGAYVIKWSEGECIDYDEEWDECWSYQEPEEVVERIDGAAIRATMECLWNEKTWACEEDWGYDVVEVTSQSQCEARSACMEWLGSDKLPSLKWDSEWKECSEEVDDENEFFFSSSLFF